jgi:4'-phosphopantetheinyl transferase
LATTLSPDERLRAERFRDDLDKTRYIVCRGFLRGLLARYTQIDPSDLEFAYGEHGKPVLAEACRSKALQFNVAHSHQLALYALTRERSVGVDVEQVRPLADAARVAAHYFSARENAALRALPESARTEAFYACWTRKEAYLKARGSGLAEPLDQFDVSLAPGVPARLLCVRRAPGEVKRWHMQTLSPAPGYIGALVVEDQRPRATCWRWSE